MLFTLHLTLAQHYTYHDTTRTLINTSKHFTSQTVVQSLRYKDESDTPPPQATAPTPSAYTPAAIQLLRGC